jgi:hypothetical protein
MVVEVRPDERRPLLALWLLGLLQAAALSIGENLAQSVFTAQVGARELSGLVLWKGLIDVAAAGLYLPLTARRSPRAVMALALGIYAFTLAAGRLWLGRGGAAPAWGLYLGHECASTLLTIHWGVYVLDRFDAAQARRLFPLVFTASRLGGVLAGLALAHLAGPVGAPDLLWLAVLLALVGAASTASRAKSPSLSPGGAVVDPDADPGDGEEAPVARLLRTWRTAWRSPLLRAIAVSTVCMVFLRYGLKLLALDAIEGHFHGDRDQVARFLGTYTSWANLAALGLALVVTPRLIARVGVGVANAVYALLVFGAYAALELRPSLLAATAARFVDVELKDALKTPLSALFYGAERPDDRAPARAFVFGAVIPAATVTTAGAFAAALQGGSVVWLVRAGLVVAGLFVVATLVQNRVYLRRHAALLEWKLGRAAPFTAPAPPPELLAVAAARGQSELAARAFRALHAADPRLVALAAEVLGETVPRALARRLAASVRSPNSLHSPRP